MAAGPRAWMAAYAVSQFLFWLGYGVYYTYTRMLIEELRGEDYWFAMLVSGVEEAPLLASVLLGFLADLLGRRRLVLLGLAEAASVLALGYVPLDLFPLFIAVASLTYSIAYLALMGLLLEGVGGSGLRYSLMAAAGSLGWAASGPLAALAAGACGQPCAYTASAALVAAGYLVAYARPPPVAAEKPRGPRELLWAIRETLPVSIHLSLSSAGLIAFFGAASIKLKALLGDPMVFGLVFTTASALTGALARPPAGAVVDRVEPRLVLAVTAVAYALLALGITLAEDPLTLAILWVIPIFPFRDAALYMALSRALPRRLQATAAGIASFTYSLGGLVVTAYTLAAPRALSLLGALVFSAALLASSIPPLLLAWKKHTSPTHSH